MRLKDTLKAYQSNTVIELCLDPKLIHLSEKFTAYLFI